MFLKYIRSNSKYKKIIKIILWFIYYKIKKEFKIINFYIIDILNYLNLILRKYFIKYLIKKYSIQTW